MQRGLPVIVTQNVGASEAVRASGGGIVVDGDAQQLSAAIEELAQNPSLCKFMGTRGERFVHENYSWASIAERMEALYASLMAARQ
jgi:glycosyltransferase involved in cell wall biosynthesis